jgi:hypothetical protein
MFTNGRVLQNGSRRARKIVVGLRDGITLAASQDPAVPYIGAVNLPNLGDVALLQAIGSVLNRVQIQVVPYTRESLTLQIARGLGLKPTHFCLGGGTLINSPAPLRGVRSMQAMGLTGFAFGTGVRDPRFWDKVDRFPRELAQWIDCLARFESVSVRGPISANILTQCGLPHVWIIGDPALQFWTPPAENAASTNRMAINLCSGYRRRSGNDERRVFEQLRTIARTLLGAGMELVFISVWAVDNDLVQEFASSLGDSSRVSVELVGSNVQRFLNLVASCDLMISMRLHAAVLAMCRSVPVISVEYQPKCGDFMASMSQARYNIRPEDLDPRITVGVINDALERRAELRLLIGQKAQYYQNQQAGFAAMIRNRLLPS